MAKLYGEENFNEESPLACALKNMKSWVIVFVGEKAEVVEERGNEDKPDRFIPRRLMTQPRGKNLTG